MKYQNIVEFKYDKVGSFKDGNPFTLAFCRTFRQGNILVKGGFHNVKAEVSKLGPALVSYRFFHNGRSRGYNRIENCGKVRCAFLGSILRPRFYLAKREDCGFELVDGESEIIIATYRKIPSTFPRALSGYLK
jgi:hypothetical protein